MQVCVIYETREGKKHPDEQLLTVNVRISVSAYKNWWILISLKLIAYHAWTTSKDALALILNLLIICLLDV